MPDHLTELELAMLKHIESIMNNEHRPFSYQDLLYFKVDGKEYTMTHGTYREQGIQIKKAKFEVKYI